MLTDADIITPGTCLEADVCIVGGGAAGLTVAHELSDHNSRVIVLERGGRRVDKRANQSNLVEVVGHPIGRPNRVRRFAVGGAGWLWARVSLELDSLDFSERSRLDHSGWPFDYEELRPFYDRARAKLGIPAGDVSTTGNPDLEGSPSDHLALRPVAFSPVRFGGPNTTDGLSIYTGATLQRLIIDGHGESVDYAEAMTPSGDRFSVKARVFVLATGGIETPRLMLLSGIGNEHDLVGRFFADHPYLTIPISLPAGSRPPEVVVRSGHARPSSAMATLSEAYVREHGLLGSAAFFMPYRDPALWERTGVQAWLETGRALRHRDRPPDAAMVYASAARGIPDLVRALVDRRRNTDRLAIRVALEPAPNPESRVSLSERSDEFGMPLPRVDWRLGSAERRALRCVLDELGAAADRGGWGPLGMPQGDGWPRQVEGGAHHMGTTRMHDEPEQGVVDPDCRVHGTTNVYVAGTSVFPTYGYANPMLTIVALAMRLGDHLKTILT